MRRLIWLFAVLMGIVIAMIVIFFFKQTANSRSGCANATKYRSSHGRSDSSHTAVFFCFFSNRQQIPDQAAQMRKLIWIIAVLIGVVTALTLPFFFQQTAKSRSGCVDAQSHMDIRCSQGRTDSSHTVFFLFVFLLFFCGGGGGWDLTFNENSLQQRQFALNVKFCLAGKNKKSIIKYIVC